MNSKSIKELMAEYGIPDNKDIKKLLMEMIHSYGNQCERYGQYDTLAQERAMDLDECDEDETEDLQAEKDHYEDEKDGAYVLRNEKEEKIEELIDYLQIIN